MVIIRMIDCHLLKEVVGVIQELIELQAGSSYNFIYPALLISKIIPEMIEENRNIMLKCAGHLFNNPLKLLALLESVMTVNATSADYKKLLLNYYS